jgi:hypothetical protein
MNYDDAEWPARLRRLGELDRVIAAVSEKLGPPLDKYARGFDGDGWVWLWTSSFDPFQKGEVVLRAQLVPFFPGAAAEEERLDISIIAHLWSKLPDVPAWSAEISHLSVGPTESLYSGFMDELYSGLQQATARVRAAPDYVEVVQRDRSAALSLLTDESDLPRA